MKILILSCNTGQGHNTAAHAVAEQLEARGVAFEIRDTLAFASETISREICDAYSGLTLRNPRAFGRAYRMADRRHAEAHRSWIYLANRLYAPAVYEYLSQGGFDAVLMTHLCAGEVMTAIRRKYGGSVPCYMLSTDYAVCPYFEELDVDRYLIPHADIRYQFTRRGIPADRIAVTGIPVSERFSQHTEKSAARRSLGLPEIDEAQLFLVMTGSMGYGATEELVAKLVRETPRNVGVVVMGGNNRKMKERLRAVYGEGGRVFVVDFTSRVPLYMDACDLLLTKPGGLSSTEAAVHGIPLVHTRPIPGCENANLSFFTEHGMSLGATGTEKAVLLATRLSGDLPAKERMLAAQAQYSFPDAAKYIVDLIMGENQKR